MNDQSTNHIEDALAKLEALIGGLKDFIFRYLFTFFSIARWCRRQATIDLTEPRLLKPFTFLTGSMILVGVVVRTTYQDGEEAGVMQWFKQASQDLTNTTAFSSVLQIFSAYLCFLLLFKTFEKFVVRFVSRDASPIQYVLMYLSGWLCTLQILVAPLSGALLRSALASNEPSPSAIVQYLVAVIISLAGMLVSLIILVGAVRRLCPQLDKLQRLKVFLAGFLVQILALNIAVTILGASVLVELYNRNHSQHDSPVEGRVHFVKHRKDAQSLKISMHLFNRKDEPLLLYADPIWIENLCLGHSGESEDAFEPLKIDEKDQVHQGGEVFTVLSEVKVNGTIASAIVLHPRHFVELTFEIALDSENAKAIELDSDSEIRFHLVFIRYGHVKTPGEENDGLIVLQKLRARITFL